MSRGRAKAALAAQTVPVPDLIGRSVQEAVDILRELGLLLVGAGGETAVTLHGLIVRQWPSPGEPLARAHEVRVWTTGGGDETGVREPRTPPPTTRRGNKAVNLDELDQQLPG